MNARLHLTGALSGAVWAWLAWASHGTETLAMLFGAVGAAWVLLGFAWFCAGAADAKAILRAIWIWGVLFRVAGFFGEPLLEDDWARYLWDGRQLIASGNPYATAPADHFADDNVSEPFRRVLDEINNPDAPTIYGPVCQFAFALSHLIAPAQLWPLKLLLLAADLLTLALLLRLAPPRHVLLYAWCPLLIQETAFSAHPDSLWVFFMVAALHALTMKRPVRLAICCGLALATKFFAVIIVPFLLVCVVWKHRLLALLVVITAYLPFWLQGSVGDFAGLARMAGDWEFNATIYAWLARWLGTSMAKVITLTAFTAIWLAMFWRWARSSCGEAPQLRPLPRGDVIFGVFFLLSPVVNPWYLLALLPFVVLQPSAWGVSALVVVTLGYAHGLNMSKPSLAAYEQPGWVPFSEFCVVALLLVALVFGRRRRLRSAERNGD
jgi:hypothetical protein